MSETFANAERGAPLLRLFRELGGQVALSAQNIGTGRQEVEVSLIAPTPEQLQVRGMEPAQAQENAGFLREMLGMESVVTTDGPSPLFRFTPCARDGIPGTQARSGGVLGIDLATANAETIEHLGLVGLVRGRLTNAADMAAAARAEFLMQFKIA